MGEMVNKMQFGGICFRLLKSHCTSQIISSLYTLKLGLLVPNSPAGRGDVVVKAGFLLVRLAGSEGK